MIAHAELRIILDTMERNDVHFQSLGQAQKDQIQTYVDKLLAAGSPIKPSDAGKSGKMAGKWRLEYSNEEKYKVRLEHLSLIHRPSKFHGLIALV